VVNHYRRKSHLRANTARRDTRGGNLGMSLGAEAGASNAVKKRPAPSLVATTKDKRAAA
jgi:hypothetical protein